MKKYEKVILFLVLVQCLVYPILYLAKGHIKSAPSVDKPELVDIAPATLIGNEGELLGARNAEFTLVEFGDYQCPPCAHRNAQVKAFLDEYPSKLRFRFVHYPMPMHSDAMRFAIVSEISRTKGQFWKVHDGLFTLNTQVSSHQVSDMLRRLHVDETHLSFTQVASAKKRVEQDIKLADTSHVDATPTFFLCGPEGRVYKLGDLSQINNYIQ